VSVTKEKKRVFQTRSENDDFSIRRHKTPTVEESSPGKGSSTLSASLRSQRVELSCSLCQFKCLSKVLLDCHNIMMHHQLMGVQHLKCDACGAVFLSKVGFETHQVPML
jgi:hypothetical protein